MNTSRFIVLEGIDGSGTTTQSKLLHQRLQDLGLPALLTFEPTNSPVGRIIRSILNRSYPAHPETLAYLFAADRHDHLHNPETGMLKYLREGSWVVLDRYVFSSLAYQSVECSQDIVSTLNNNFPLPEITFFLDLPAEVSLKRIDLREGSPEIYEKEEFQQKVRKQYQDVLSRYKGQTEIITMDAQLPADLLHEEIWKHLTQRISIASP